MKHNSIASRFHWGWRIGIVYSVFALVTIGFAVFSMTQTVDLVQQDYYASSVVYDKHQERISNTLNASQQIQIQQNTESLVVQFPENGTRGTLQLYRPSTVGADIIKDITNDSNNNSMTISTKGMLPGLWILQITYDNNGKEYYYEKRVTL